MTVSAGATRCQPAARRITREASSVPTMTARERDQGEQEMDLGRPARLRTHGVVGEEREQAGGDGPDDEKPERRAEPARQDRSASAQAAARESAQRSRKFASMTHA